MRLEELVASEPAWPFTGEAEVAGDGAIAIAGHAFEYALTAQHELDGFFDSHGYKGGSPRVARASMYRLLTHLPVPLHFVQSRVFMCT
jgi:hypothetical protein